MEGEITMKPVTEVIKAGEGAQGTALSVHQGMVVMHFQRPIEYASFDPETARRISEQMAKYAYQAHFGRAPSDAENQSFVAQGIRKRVTAILREKMVNRTVMLLRNFQETKPTLDYQAQTIVDRVLAEVT